MTSQSILFDARGRGKRINFKPRYNHVNIFAAVILLAARFQIRSRVVHAYFSQFFVYEQNPIIIEADNRRRCKVVAAAN